MTLTGISRTMEARAQLAILLVIAWQFDIELRAREDFVLFISL